MINYGNSYLNEIKMGLEATIVTDKGGNRMTMDEGLEKWAAAARSVQQITNGLLFFAGNGASAAMAEHMSHDWFQNAIVNTQTCSETSHITAISNDLSYEDVFSYRIGRILSEKDILVTISSSGNSPNVIKAIQTASENGTFVITLSGKREENKSRQLGDLNFYVPLDTYGLVESAHAVLLHCALDYFLDLYMGGRH